MSAELENDNEATPCQPAPIVPAKSIKSARVAYGRPPEFLGNRFVYAVISQRAHGLSIGINFNPDKTCNFDCAYCEVDRELPARDTIVDLEVLASELETLLNLTQEKRLRELPYFQNVPEELLALRSVALSGEGEPDLRRSEPLVSRVLPRPHRAWRLPLWQHIQRHADRPDNVDAVNLMI